MIGSKATTILPMFFFYDYSWLLWILLLALVAGGIWHVTCYTWNFFWQKVPEKSQKCQKMHTSLNMTKRAEKGFKKTQFHDICATIPHTYRVVVSRMQDFFLVYRQERHSFISNIFHDEWETRHIENHLTVSCTVHCSAV